MCVIGVLERVELLFSLSWTLLFLSKGKQTALVAIKPTSKSPVSSPATIFFFSNTDTVFKTEWMSWWEQCQVSQKFSMRFIWQVGSLSLSRLSVPSLGADIALLLFFLKWDLSVTVQSSLSPPPPHSHPTPPVCPSVTLSTFLILSEQYLLNRLTTFNQSWCGDVVSWAGVSYRKKYLLSSRPRCQQGLV